MDAFEQAVEKYHASLMEFVKGNAEPALEMWSQRDDVVLMQSVPAVRTWTCRARGNHQGCCVYFRRR